MSITSHTRHDTCPVWIVYHPEKIHTASLVCKTHKKWIQWLSRQDMRMLLDNDLAEIRPRHIKMIKTADDLNL
jgi:hypothetical protein